MKHYRITNRFVALMGALCVMLATVGGVIAAHSVTSISFGGETTFLDELDAIPQGEMSVVNILLLGVDEGGMRSDTIMLVSMNGHTNEINVLSIPRDTRIPVGNGHQKVNAAIGIGAQEVRKGNYEEPEDYAVRKIKELTGLPIHYFMTVDFDGFKDIIDVLGGVDFEIPFHMKYDDPVQNLHIDLKPGMQHLDGEAAHDFVRFRQGNPGYSGYATGDLGRIEAQQAFLKAIVAQKLQPKYLADATDIFGVVTKYVRTNYSVKDLLRHLGPVSKMSADKVRMHQLPGAPRMISGISYYLADTAATSQLVNTVFDENRKTPLDSTEE